jgi:phosphatidylserine/phosphatidylglycerophosphate/cardiolipin synthase-like enzyme
VDPLLIGTPPMGSDDNWFTSIGTPPRPGNFVVPLVDGEEAWRTVFGHLRTAKKSIHMTFWMLHLDHELRRSVGNTFKQPSERYEDTLRKILLDKHNEGVAVRILLWELPINVAPVLIFPPVVVSIRSGYQDMDLRRYGQSGVFEVMYEEHPASSDRGIRSRSSLTARSRSSAG